jgi:hypothetical protein
MFSLLTEVGDREMWDENLADAVKAVFDASFATETAYSVFRSKNMLSSGPGRPSHRAHRRRLSGHLGR